MDNGQTSDIRQLKL